jgi:iron complex outermembrane receptor protein
MINTRIQAALSTVCVTTGLLAFAPTASFAQSVGTPETGNTASLGEVVVTAQRRSEKMVDVPISITAIGDQQLTTANVQGLSDITKLTPALRFDNQAGFFQPSIRGIGTGVTTSGGGSNVGIYIDGFYSPNPLAADFQMTNVTSVQVLKGPQGTLFGHNTTGGAILVTTSDPSTETSAMGKISYARFNTQRYEGYATTGIGGGAAVDIAGQFTKGDGFITNIIDHDDKEGAYQNWTVRTGLKFELGDNVSILARYVHSKEDDPTSILTNSNTDTTIDPSTGKPWGVQTFAVPGLFTTNPNQVANNLPTFVTSKTDIAQLTVKADLGFGNLTSYSQWRQEDVNQSENLDQTGLPIFQLGLPIFDRTISQELLLTSKEGNALQWTAGAFFFSNIDKYQTFIDNGVATGPRVRFGGSSSTTQSIAGFLDATYEVMPKLFITAGARYSHDEVKDAYYNSQFIATINPVPSISSNKVTPRVVVRYKTTDESSVYASFSKGYKAAIIDVGGSCQNAPFICNDVKPEDVKAFEVGYKFETRGFSSQTAAFYYDYTNLQVSEFLANAQASIINAAKSKIYGLEEELSFTFNDHVSLNGGISWTHARYTTFGTTVNGQLVGAPIYKSCATAPVGKCSPGAFDYVDTSTITHDTDMQHVPEITATLGPRFTTGMTNSGEYAVSGNWYYTSKYYSSPSGTQFLQPSYNTLSLRAEWKTPSEHYTVALFGDNVTDKRYRTAVQYNGFGIGASWSEPAAWGIELGAKF